MLIGIVIIATTAYAVELECAKWCFDPTKNSATKGYDPEFLQQPIVKDTCIQAHADLQEVGLSDLGYCDKNLGTLP